MTVLLIGRDADLHIDAVLVELQTRGVPWIRLDPERIVASKTRLEATYGDCSSPTTIETYAGHIEPHEISGVLCRYALEAIELPTADAIARFAAAEFQAAQRGILLHIDAHRWVNDPFAEARADHKPFQLFAAQRVGLKVPPTLVSQDLAALKRFAKRHGRCVIKPISDVGLARCSGSYFNEIPSTAKSATADCSFTGRFDPAMLDRENIDLSCPVLLQAEIAPKTDLRVTVVDDQVFAAEITQVDSHHSLDVRNCEKVEIAALDIGVTADAVCALVHRLGLRFAACDFVRAPDGLYFLEANVSGNWLWTENGANLPISQALAGALSLASVSE